MSYAQVSVTLPQAMLKEVTKFQKKSHFTRSELFRAALNKYFLDFLPTEEPTPAERRAINRGLAAVSRGEVHPLSEVLDEMGR